MMLSRWRRVATGVAAGIIVLCAALIGASFRDDSGGVSVASDLRPANVIPIAEDPVDDPEAADGTDAADSTDGDSTDPVTVIGADDLAEAAGDDGAGDGAASETTDDGTDASATADDTASDAASDDAGDTAAAEDAASDDAGDTAAAEDAASDDAGDTAADTAGTAEDPATTAGTTDAGSAETATQTPPAPADEALGLGGGVDDAECALDRLVIYAGARRGGVAGSIRNALAAAGFAVGCPAPVTVLASNCPLQFAGVLGAGSGYDPMNSFVASSSSVNRETMTAVMASMGYSGAEINILDFSFVNPDKPGEQWMAIFIPPSFAGWENLAGRAGLSPTTSSLCASSGELVG